MKGLDLGNKNVYFSISVFVYLSSTYLPMVAQFFKGDASLEVTRQREVAMDLTSLTGATEARGAERPEQGSEATTVGGTAQLH
jgi:hypothetical protein